MSVAKGQMESWFIWNKLLRRGDWEGADELGVSSVWFFDCGSIASSIKFLMSAGQRRQRG